jgi:N-acetylglucosamine kinase-like BadF-type ATPase
MKFYLGMDGGQSHTTALLGDGRGRVLGRGDAGPSNHTREPGGRERLIAAVTGSIEGALRSAGLPAIRPRFVSAHLALTGEPEEKIEIVHDLIAADHLVIGHDAPGALAGAHAGADGVIVLAGTGSVACGEITDPDGLRRYVRVGGHGYLFSDEGSAFHIAQEALRRALRDEDAGGEDRLRAPLLRHFRRPTLKSIAQDCYAGTISRDRLASFAAVVATLAERRPGLAREILSEAAQSLAALAILALERLGDTTPLLDVAYGGGVFRSERLRAIFAQSLESRFPGIQVRPPRYGPEIGALLLAYRGAGKRLTPAFLETVEASAASFLSEADHQDQRQGVSRHGQSRVEEK